MENNGQYTEQSKVMSGMKYHSWTGQESDH